MPGTGRAGSAKKAALCHPESFDKLKINSAKDLEILRRPALSGTPQNDNRDEGFLDGKWKTYVSILIYDRNNPVHYAFQGRRINECRTRRYVAAR